MNIELAIEVIGKIISGMFFTPEAFVILGMFGLGAGVFWIKAKLEKVA